MKRLLLLAAALLAGLYLVWGARLRAARATRVPPAIGEVRGAWHVHTTRSDGRGTLDEVVRAARGAGLQFVVVADHNVLAGADQGYRDGVLVVMATEASTRYGHVVALGVPRALDSEEREGDPLRAIAALGGQAILAHPFHPRRPFTGWGKGPWRGFELVSNDSSWHEVVHGQHWDKALAAVAILPWDRARAVIALSDDLRDERTRFDAELKAARATDDRRPARVVLCSADAHGWPSYGAAFEAFSMHVSITLSGDAAPDARGIVAALTDGRAACVFDGVAPASSVRLARAAGGRAIELSLDAPELRGARFTLLRDGVPVAESSSPVASGAAVVRFGCGAPGCGPGDYRVEASWNGRPWIFTNPLTIE